MIEIIEYCPITMESLRDEYYNNHRSCPKCGYEYSSQTLIAYTFDLNNPQDFRDENECVCCKCKDIHIVHDRVKT